MVVTPYATLGGSERWLLALLDGAAARLDAEVWLLEDGPLRAELERRDVPTLVLPTGPDARSLAARGADLARRLRAGAADVLLANGVKAAAAAVPAARLVGVPVVWAKHDFSFDSTLARPLGALADAVLATSAAVAAATGRDDAVLVPPRGPPARSPRAWRPSPSGRRPVCRCPTRPRPGRPPARPARPVPLTPRPPGTAPSPC